MHFDKTEQCSEGRISVASKASISLGCDSWGLVGDTKLPENTRINDNLNTEFLIWYLRHICKYRTNSWRNLGQNLPGVRIHVVRISRDTCAIVVRHSRDDSRDKIGNFGHLLLSHDGHANVAQQSNDSYVWELRKVPGCWEVPGCWKVPGCCGCWKIPLCHQSVTV